MINGETLRTKALGKAKFEDMRSKIGIMKIKDGGSSTSDCASTQAVSCLVNALMSHQCNQCATYLLYMKEQTVAHVHIHLIPRKKGDFEKNDEIYDAIDVKEKELKEKLDLDIERKDRTMEEMAHEANEYRALFS
ncbi:unnamed protein product [Miscanthus lutarioriparius]|uniref:HIT domain-containing protein n=1 Tax=Miscanthus lutarioriparius TaxID=422564 RepID=A0A811RL47_9POAL|nr:unnamed protein product [Miscanthus lutarioriparius]